MFLAADHKKHCIVIIMARRTSVQTGPLSEARGEERGEACIYMLHYTETYVDIDANCGYIN